jgi:hypothetical protein
MTGICLAINSSLFSQDTSSGVNLAQSSKSIDLFPDEVVAKGDGIEIKRSQLDEAFVLVKAKLLAGSQYIPDERRKVLEARLLDRLIATKLLLKKATEEDKRRRKKRQKSLLRRLNLVWFRKMFLCFNES